MRREHIVEQIESEYTYLEYIQGNGTHLCKRRYRRISIRIINYGSNNTNNRY